VLSDGRLSGRIIYWPGGGKATTTVPELEPTFFLPLLFRQTLGRRWFSPPAACCSAAANVFRHSEAVHQLSSFAILLVVAGDGGGTCSTVVSFF